MDPVSSLRFAVSPELRAAGLPKPSEALGLRAIPASELEKLGGLTESQGAPSIGKGSSSFESALGKVVNEVNTRQQTANEAVNGLMGGQEVPLHQAVIAMEEASVSFQLMVEVRNKLLESYQELMRMQV